MLSSLHPPPALETALADGPAASAAETTFRWLARPYALLDDCAARYGDTFTLRFTRFGTHVIVADPDDVRRVFAADRDVLLGGRGNVLLAPILGQHSLLLLDGQRHATERGVLLAALRPDRTKGYADIIAEVAAEAAASWRDGEALDVHAAALTASKTIILRAVCGVAGRDLDRLSQAVSALMAVVETNAPFDDPTADSPVAQRFRTALAGVHEALDAHTARRRSDGPAARPDVTGALLDAGLTDDAIRQHLLSLVLAGHETTAAAISWTLLSLDGTPAARARLEHELATTASQPPQQLAQLPYLRATCLEALRLHPPVPVISREVRRPFALRDLLLPEGTFVTPCAYLAQRRASSFPDPVVFRPERFLEHRPNPDVYFPFGGGARRCLGMGLALLELPIVLGTWLRAARFTLTGTPRATRRAVTVIPGGRWRMHVTRL